MIVIDTHIWVWFIDSPSELSKNALSVIEKAKAGGRIFISCISTWELYMLEKKGRLKLKIPVELWIRKCEKLTFLNFVPIHNDIINISANLPEPLHQDPADRFIISTAKYSGAPLVTKDKKILKYPHVETVW